MKQKKAWISVVGVAALGIALSGGGCSGGGGQVSGGDDAGIGQDSTSGGGSGCTTNADCASQVPPTTPPGCATGKCDALQGTCSFVAKDNDGDGDPTANCKANNGVPIQVGGDCNDADPGVYSGHPENCSELPDGGTAPMPCSPGQKSCLADGTESACIGTLVCVNQACIGGKCVGACEPGQTQCTTDLTGVQTCSNGMWATTTTCDNQTCVVSQASTGDAGQDDAGTAGVASCQGVCSPGGTQCAPGQNGPQTCNAQGQWSVVTPCAASTTCETNGAGIASCQGACGPGQKTCAASSVETCQNGMFGSPVACTGSTPACLNGSCVQCTPTTKQCSGNTPQTCNSAGQWVSGTSCTNVCTGAGQCTGNCVPGSTGCTPPYSWTCPSGTQVQGAATVACGATCNPGDPGSINCLNCATETCTSSGSPGQCSPEGACAQNSTGTCTWTGYPSGVPAGACPPTPVTCSSTCGWNACTPNPGQFAPTPGVGGVSPGLINSPATAGKSGPNCFGSSNNYPPTGSYTMCPAGSHATSATCQMVPQNGGVTDGSCGDSFPATNQVVLTVVANSNCTVAAYAYLVITCAPDSCGTGTPGP